VTAILVERDKPGDRQDVHPLLRFHGQTEVALCKLHLSYHFYLSLFGLKVKNFHRPTGCIHIAKDIDKMARMGDIASAASD
jgi:hypothetical protein